ncbi:phosphonate degradation HD-domain oxygenase [Aquisphaera giovannonii]|uniref:phosphonate degradation HD-domain oxygenase n=1 Tax=Aquisphaera giovannonii TaxID=406548 RepID=UPI00143D74CA|nr:phosphonate degradation HD-domain oxygenase [Aquisphaera giovannonii]
MDGTPSLTIRRSLTLGLLIAGYTGYYACRSNLSVAQTMIIQDLGAAGVSAEAAKLGLGAAISLGILAYALGKPFAGPLADFFGGRAGFLGGMAGSIACTVAFAMSGTLPAFTAIWAGNRLVQSFGWAGAIKVVSRWFPPSRYGTAMGLLSLSFLFGDAAARLAMGRLIDLGFGWRGIFLASAGILSGLLVINGLWLRESPAELGLPEPDAGDASVYGKGGDRPRASGLRKLLVPLLRSPSFWLVCGLSLGLTLLRESFNAWSPTYFAESLGLSRADAARASSLFPLFGGISVLLAGYLGDRLGRAGRGAVILAGLSLAGLGLLALGMGDFGRSQRIPIALVAAVAFCLLGPYSYLAGAISLDLGGKHGGATASGFVDAAGYLGGALAGWGLARTSIDFGWRGVFLALAVVAWASAAVAMIYLLAQRRAELRTEDTAVDMNHEMPSLYERIERIFTDRGDSAYFGEDVTQSEHALQSAHLAEREGASAELIVAALLHDIGHLVAGHDEDLADRGIDGRHEETGPAWLSEAFGLSVIEPIRLHVAAKRYLCAVDPAYAGSLSEASRQSLTLQGGPFDAEGVAEFEANPHHRDAIRLRRWDDTAKVPGLDVPGLSHYRGIIESAVGAGAR